MQPLIGHDGVFYYSLQYGPRQRATSHILSDMYAPDEPRQAFTMRVIKIQ